MLSWLSVLALCVSFEQACGLAADKGQQVIAGVEEAQDIFQRDINEKLSNIHGQPVGNE